MDYTTMKKIIVTGGLALLAAGCNDSPTSPAAPGGGGTTATVTSVAVSGELAVSEGSTSQLTATATLSDGSSQDVSSQATWQSSDTAVATVSATGLVSGLKTGTADISAAYRGRTGRSTVQVAAASYRLTVSGLSVTALNTCDDFTQGLTEGEFYLRARVITASGGQRTLFQTPGYPGSASQFRGLKFARNQTRTFGGSETFTLNGAPGQSLRIQFNATEWDTQIVLIPPSTRWVQDGRMSDRSGARTHAFQNGSFSRLGPNSVTLGNSSCGIRLNYTISANRQ